MSSRLVANPTRQLRIGLVLYGGVSLAIYMYGVTREFWHLLRASAGLEPNPYADVLKSTSASATIDVISGTSAGGINGILLGKALATGADLPRLARFWIDQADFANLLRSEREPTPRSLLRSDFFEQQVSEVFREMDRSATGQRLVSVLDLFVSGTRLRGMVREFTDSLGQTVQTLVYRKMFPFRLRTKGYNPLDPALGYDHNDFEQAGNAALAEAARATSAFPAAFEPKLIRKRADNSSLFSPDDPPEAYFSDGGILHNKPFTEMLDTIFARQSDGPVQRWVFSVEPNPERYAPAVGPGPDPDVLEVIFKAGSTIPMYQSIAGDLDRLNQHNARVRSLGAQLARIEEIIATKFASVVNAGTPQQFRAFLDQQVMHYAYQGLRLEAVISALTARLARTASLPDDQREFIEDGVRARAAAVGETPFLDAFDDGFEIRRVSYLLTLLDDLITTLAPPHRRIVDAPRANLWTQMEQIRGVGRRVFGEDPVTAAAVRSLRGQGGIALSTAVQGVLGMLEPAMTAGLRPLRQALVTTCQNIEKAVNHLRTRAVHSSGYPPQPFAALFERYELRDMFILPMDLLADVGERQEVRFIRISPEAATYVQKRPADKLSGDILGHFGGFLAPEWRANDILWGRLDAAEVIMRVLLDGQNPATVEQHIRAAQERICREELSSWQPATHPNYKTYLERDYHVGAQTLADLPPETRVPLGLRAGWVLRNMLRALEQGAGPGVLGRILGHAGRAMGLILGFVQWPVLAIWGRDRLITRLITVALLFFFGWSVLTAVAAFLGLIALTGTLLLWMLVLALPFVIWVLLRNGQVGVLLVVAILALLAVLGWGRFAAWLRSAL